MCNRLFPRAHLSVAARLASPLYTDIIPPLEERGFLADTIVTGVRSWEGIVRLPERNAEGKWGERRERLADINKCLGSYKRVILQCVLSYSIPHTHNHATPIAWHQPSRGEQLFWP